MLRTRAAGAPVLLVLDDLHHAGLATIEQLHLLARSSGREAAAGRGDAAHRRGRRGPAPARAGGRTADARSARRRRGAARSPPRPGTPTWPTSIAQRTRGHPLSVVEMLRAISAGETGVPASLTAAVLGRVGRLAAPEQELVRAACVLGASFEPATVAAAARDPDAGRGAQLRPARGGGTGRGGRAVVRVRQRPGPGGAVREHAGADPVRLPPARDGPARRPARDGGRARRRVRGACTVPPRPGGRPRPPPPRDSPPATPSASWSARWRRPGRPATSCWSDRCCSSWPASARPSAGTATPSTTHRRPGHRPAHRCGRAGDACAPGAGWRRPGGAGSADGQLRPAPGGGAADRQAARRRRDGRRGPRPARDPVVQPDGLPHRPRVRARRRRGGPAQRRRHGGAARAGRPEDHVRVRRRPGRPHRGRGRARPPRPARRRPDAAAVAGLRGVVRPAGGRRLGPGGRGRRGGAGTDPAQRPDHVRGLADRPPGLDRPAGRTSRGRPRARPPVGGGGAAGGPLLVRRHRQRDARDHAAGHR